MWKYKNNGAVQELYEHTSYIEIIYMSIEEMFKERML